MNTVFSEPTSLPQFPHIYSGVVPTNLDSDADLITEVAYLRKQNELLWKLVEKQRNVISQLKVHLEHASASVKTNLPSFDVSENADTSNRIPDTAPTSRSSPPLSASLASSLESNVSSHAVENPVQSRSPEVSPVIVNAISEPLQPSTRSSSSPTKSDGNSLPIESPSPVASLRDIKGMTNQLERSLLLVDSNNLSSISSEDITTTSTSPSPPSSPKNTSSSNLKHSSTSSFSSPSITDTSLVPGFPLLTSPLTTSAPLFIPNSTLKTLIDDNKPTEQPKSNLQHEAPIVDLLPSSDIDTSFLTFSETSPILLSPVTTSPTPTSIFSKDQKHYLSSSSSSLSNSATTQTRDLRHISQRSSSLKFLDPTIKSEGSESPNRSQFPSLTETTPTSSHSSKHAMYPRIDSKLSLNVDTLKTLSSNLGSAESSTMSLNSIESLPVKEEPKKLDSLNPIGFAERMLRRAGEGKRPSSLTSVPKSLEQTLPHRLSSLPAHIPPPSSPLKDTSLSFSLTSSSSSNTSVHSKPSSTTAWTRPKPTFVPPKHPYEIGTLKLSDSEDSGYKPGSKVRFHQEVYYHPPSSYTSSSSSSSSDDFPVRSTPSRSSVTSKTRDSLYLQQLPPRRQSVAHSIDPLVLQELMQTDRDQLQAKLAKMPAEEVEKIHALLKERVEN